MQNFLPHTIKLLIEAGGLLLEYFTSVSGLYWRPGFYSNIANLPFLTFLYIVCLIAYTLQNVNFTDCALSHILIL